MEISLSCYCDKVEDPNAVFFACFHSGAMFMSHRFLESEP